MSSLYSNTATTEGCFKQRKGANKGLRPGYDSNGANVYLAFDASKADATYSGSTFQPRAGLMLLCIKS